MSTIAAFFDVDETLIKMKSMFHFYQYWSELNGWKIKHQAFDKKFKEGLSQGTPREELNRMYYREFSGVNIQDLNRAGEAWFKEFFGQSDIYIASAVNALNQHKKQGHITVFLSGSMQPILQPLGHYLDVDAILAAPLVINDAGILSGEIGQPQTIGMGKQHALLAFSQKNNINLSGSYAYGDDLSDIPMLEVTGNPICVGANSKLAEYAQQHHWNILDMNIADK
ncbi:HAD family hydrolase [Ewingella americana]|uniref:HAD family hydrolase n=1 Tax=Ewingella americana TaxID=41202 RepID=UPI00163AE87C|nr:HAD-IB family hydrolase [Ewingella americana]QMV53369.1 HAD-IB family hydrolase [Ewingella americana]